MYDFCDFVAHAKFQNLSSPPSSRKLRVREEEEDKNNNKKTNSAWTNIMSVKDIIIQL